LILVSEDQKKNYSGFRRCIRSPTTLFIWDHFSFVWKRLSKFSEWYSSPNDASWYCNPLWNTFV